MLDKKVSYSHLPPFFTEADISLTEFDAICSQEVHLADYPRAIDVQKKVVIYSGDDVREALDNGENEAALKVELCRVLKDGPGVFVIKKAFTDMSIIDRGTEVFREIVREEKESGQGQGDHFGNNERVWNAIQKMCVKDPELFIDYYGNPILALACQAWLGPNYQISAQLNNVKPGSKAQAVHRDYHLGFQSTDTIAQYPAHTQVMSQYLTLQGAIAHVDMPLESGPTVLLPFSHQYEPGYLSYKRPEFKAYCEENIIQLPFEKGDMIFFSPALYHGAGTNQGQTDRMANLVQISSAFGRTMETIDNEEMVQSVYPALKGRVDAGTIGDRQVRDTIAAAADGYSFPTNLDSDPPIGGNAPETGQQMMHRALEQKWKVAQMMTELEEYAQRRKA